jgi:serine/tyrosine/threonine adenylyltransferase
LNVKQNEVSFMNFDNSYTRLPDAFYKRVMPSSVTTPKIALFNERLALSLGVSARDASIFSGNVMLEGAEPLAQSYAGHQFGHFNILGDGRAILLGEHITPSNERFDIQLKGAGETPFSRRGDGRATLPAMLREYLISEAMVGLGVPTTRSLAVTLTGDEVYRETGLQGAVLTRIAASHIRVGTFQYAATQGLVKELADYTIARHYKGMNYLEFLQAVIARQAKLIAKWLALGFIHGVMNTDNMSICGETIDYGPCAFMDTYDPATVFSSIDKGGRYAYGNQPKMGLWNLTRFAECLLDVIDETEVVAALETYATLFQAAWLGEMRLKLGLMNDELEDALLVQGFLDKLQTEKADYTNSFRDLTVIASETKQSSAPWYSIYNARLKRNSVSLTKAQQVMNAHNPFIIPRNHRVEEALSAANYGDYSFIHRLLEAFEKPFEENEAYEDLCTPSDSEGYKTFCGT